MQPPKTLVRNQTYQIASVNARADDSHETTAVLGDYLKQIDDWPALLEQLEHHGLTPVFYHRAKDILANVDAHSQRVLKGLYVKHKLRWSNKLIALRELRASFQAKDIPFVLLKGAALANQVYAAPWHRCMEDLDILIDPNQADAATAALAELGYVFCDAEHETLDDHHHLPAALKWLNQQQIMVELHTQALSPDMFTPISITQLSEPLRTTNFDDKSWQVLGHIDTLRVLCLHTFSRDEVIKLSGIVDLIRYGQCFFDDIDWARVKTDHPFIINTLSLCQCVVDLPKPLNSITAPLSADTKTKMKGVGFGMAPLRHFYDRSIPMVERLKKLFFPAAWWMHIFYGVPANASLTLTRYFRHPALVIFWITKKTLQKITHTLKQTGTN